MLQIRDSRDCTMGQSHFRGNFTQQEPIPEAAIEAAVAVMRSGRLHRYNVQPGELSHTARLELSFAASVGSRYCLACSSGGYALQLALRAWGVQRDEVVLTNAFTLPPVPGAIRAVGAVPWLIESTPNLTIDLEDLEAQIRESGARVLLLSHMRGHLTDMDALCELLARHEVALIEDCAHTMGARWRDRPSGRFGAVGCFSTQTYKHINSGEGGFLVSDDPTLMARAVLLSGSYMLYERHAAAPPPEAYAELRLEMPNMSGRMDELRAAILQVQLEQLPENAERWNARYQAVAKALADTPGLTLPQRPPEEYFVGSSIQFFCPDLDTQGAEDFLRRCRERGVELKWFGAKQPQAYTSHHQHWHYVPERPLPRTDAILAGLFDMRLPLTFSLADCTLIGQIIRESLLATQPHHPAEAHG